MSVQRYTASDAGAARLRAEFEVYDALNALKAAVPGSVVAGWIERRVANARKALENLTRAEAERESAAASVESDAPSVMPKLLVDVDTPLPNVSHASLTSLGSPTTQIWFTPRASVFWRSWSGRPSDHGGAYAWPITPAELAQGAPARSGMLPKDHGMPVIEEHSLSMTPLPSRKRLAPEPDAEPDAGPEGTTFARTLRAPPRFPQNPPEAAGMAHEGESTDHLEDLSGGGGGSRSTHVLATIVTWTISAFKTRGIYIDPSFKLDRNALKRVTRVIMVLPLVNGAAALLELLSRLILLILFLALSCAPHHRTVIVRRFHASMRMHVQSVRRLSSLTDVDDTSARRRKSSFPPEATVLIVGHSTVGKTALGDALHRLARKVGSPPPPRACSPPARLMLAPLPLPCKLAHSAQAHARASASAPHAHRRGARTGW
jgi:hypothetical protein